MQLTRHALGIVTAIVLAAGTGVTAVAGATAAGGATPAGQTGRPVSTVTILADDNPGPLFP